MRNRIDDWSRASSSWNDAESTLPDGVLHSRSPSTRGSRRSDDAAVAERVGIAVGVVGVGQIAFTGGVVANERDLGGVAPKRGARQRQPSMGVREGLPDAVAPRLLVPGMVHLVEDHEPLDGQSRELRGRGTGGHLLVGGDEAVHVASQAVARRPVRVEFETQSMGGQRPLGLQVAGRCDHDERSGRLGEARPSTREGERRLPGAGCRHREEVLADRPVGQIRDPTGSEEIERGALPRAEGDRRHV